MSLDKSRIPKRGNSSRKFIPEKQRKTMTDPFVDWIKRTRSDKEETVSGRMVETRSQKTSEERRELLEVEVNTDHTMNDNQGVNGLEGRGRRLASESTPVEQGHDFATSTGTLDRKEMSELSDISTEVTATRRSPTDNTMMASGTGKQTTSSSFSERMKNTFGNIFPFSMGGGAGNDGESQEEEDEEEQGDFGSQVSLNSSIQENEAYVGRETGTMDKFGVVTTISKEAKTPGQSKDFAIRTSSEPQTGEGRTRGLGNALADPEIDNEKTSRQRVKARISTSTKLPGTDRVTPPLVTPLMDNGVALEEALNNIVGSLGEQNEQMSIRMSELERAVHIERESLREEINRNKQEVDRSEKRLKERTEEHMTMNLSRMTREAEQRELRLRADMEKLRIQQEQSLGSLDTKIDAMMERRTQAIMDRLDGLLSSKSGPKEGEPNSGGPSREPRVNFNEHQRRKTYGSTRGRGSSSGYATRGNTAWGPNSRANSTRNRQTSDERPTQGTHATGRSDSGNRGHASPKRSHAGQAGNAHGDSDCRDAPHTEPSTRCEDTQAGHSREATAMATAFEPLNRSLETFLTRLSRTNERSEKSRRVFKKPRCYKDESDDCIDTWIEVMKLHFEEEDLSERQECSALTSNLEGTALNCVMAKKQYQRDTAEKIFEILLNRFGSGVQGHQAMMRFEKRRQREDETIDKFLDDLEMLRRRSQPDESNRRMNLAVASKFIDGVKNDELRTMLATHYTPLSTNAPTPEELRLKSKEYLLLKPPSRSGYYKNNYGNFNNGPANQGNNWYKPREDMDKRRSCANCSSTDHHVSACPAYKQGMKAIGFSLQDEDASELDHEDFMRGVIAKFGPRCFFCNLEGHFKSDCPQFWDAVADIKHPRHEEALSGVKASKARLLSEAEARRKDKPQELAAKKMQAVTEEAREPEPATAADDFKIDYKAAAKDALNRVQQELVTKEIEQKVKLELENEKLQEQLNTFEAMEFEETKTPSSLDMKLKVISGKRFGMAPQGKKIQSIISVAGHQVIRNLSEPSEFTLMHLDTYADYLRQVEPRTESRAVRALLTTGGPRMKKLHGRYLEVYGPYQIMLNVDGISIYTRTYITTDDDQMGQIYLGGEELKVRRIGHDAMMEQDAVHIGYEADVTAHLLDTNGTKIGVTGLLDTGAVVSVMPIKTWERMGFTREDLIPTNLRLAAANRGAIYVAGRTPVTVLHMGGRNLWMSFLVVENLDDADQFILGRDFVRNFDVMIDLNNGLIRIRNPDRKYVKRPVNRIITDENKVPVFLDRKVKLQPGQAVVAIFRMRNLNSLSDSKQVCLVPNPNSQSSVILGRSFSVKRNGLCVGVLLNTLDTTVSIQRGKKLGYALPMRTDYEETQNLKKYSVKDCPYHANKDKILKRIDELKSIRKLFSMKSETDDGLSSCSNFPERPSSYELESDKPVLPEIEHLKGKIGEGDFEKLRDLLNRNADVFSKHKADIGCCNFVEHEIELEEGAVPHREGARRMTPHKSEACRAEIEMLLEYDMIEPSKSPWACGVVMAKKKGVQLRFCCDFRYLNAVTIKDAYPIPRIDESLSKLGDAKFFTTLDLGSAFWQVPLRKKDREKTGFACELGLYQWKRMHFGLCNATATFQRLMAQALTGVTKKYGNLLMCYVDDVVIATPTLEDGIDRLDEVFGCMKRAGLKCKPSKCEILRDSIKYLGRMVDRHGVRPDPEAVEAVLTWKAPRTDTQLMSFLGFANYYREFIKGYADKVYPMQKLMRNKGKKFEWNDEAQVAFENIKRELCEAPVLGMPTEKGMYVLDTDASVVAISGILHQEQEWNGRTVLRPIAYGSKVLSDTEMKYGAPKAEMFAVVTFVEKYRAYLGSAPFKLRVDNRALSWLMTYSMDQSYIGRWIVRLDGYHMIIEHRMRDKHQNADSLSKKTEFYERLEQKQANQAEVKEGFSFLDKQTYEALPLTRWLDKSGHPIPGHPELPVEKAAEIKILSREDPVPLDLLLRSNLVQQELSRMNINSLSLLDKTVQVTPQVMRMLGGLLEREVTRDDPEWTAAVATLTISEKVKIMPSRRQHEENERDCRTIVQQLVSSIPQEILTSTSYGQKGQESGRQKKTVTFVDRDKDGEVVKQKKRWIENGAPDKGDLEEDSYRILRQYFMQKEGRLYLNKDGIVACRRREEDKVLYKYNAIVLPQLYQTELLFRSHDQMGHQGIDKVYQRILKRFEWPGMKKACEKWVTACLSCQQVKDPRKLRFPLQSIESSEFNEVVQIDHQKICMTDSGYNQVLVMIDHFTKYAEAVPCITASAEETCDHLINTWIARHGCPMTFQSDNGTAFVGELTKELMRRSQVAQAHSTTYHPQTNGLVERQNRTLVSMLRVYCSRYMTDWDRYLPQVMGAYNSTQHSTTGVSPHMMLTGHEKSLPLTFFYPEYEGKKTSPQVYVRDVIRRQQELNDLCRRNTQQAQAKQRKRFDKKAAGAKAYSVGDYVWVFQNVIPPKGTKKLLKKWRGPFMITEVHQEGRFYRLSTGRAAHYENIKPHNPSTEDWCIPADMEEGDYLMMDPACEVNEKGTRQKNDGNEIVEDGTDTPLDLDPNEQIEADDETLPYAEEDWQNPEQTEVPKNLEPDLPFTIQTRQKEGTRPRKKYNPYGDDFVVDRIDLKKIVEEVVGLEEITVSQDIDIVNDHNDEWVDDWSKPEVEFDDEQQQSYEQDQTNLRVLEWLNETTSDPEKTSVTIQDVDRESMKYIKTERDDPSWAAQEGRLIIPASNLDLIPGMRSTGTPMDIFVRGVGVGLTHTENLIIIKLRIARETGNLEAETGEEPKKPDIGRVVES